MTIEMTAHFSSYLKCVNTRVVDPDEGEPDPVPDSIRTIPDS